jgi:hypothetical protein
MEALVIDYILYMLAAALTFNVAWLLFISFKYYMKSRECKMHRRLCQERTRRLDKIYAAYTEIERKYNALVTDYDFYRREYDKCRGIIRDH